MKERGGGATERLGTAPSGGRDVDFSSPSYQGAVKTISMTGVSQYSKDVYDFKRVLPVGGKQAQLKVKPL